MIVDGSLPHGHQAVQAAHVAFNFSLEYPEMTREWFTKSQYLVILSVPCEADLESLGRDADGLHLRVSRYCEPDLDNSLTAIALGPQEASRLLVARLPLAMREEALA